MSKHDLTVERLKELFNYDSQTGVFTHRTNRRGRTRAGDVAGVIQKVMGYRVIGVDGHSYRAHRLAWLYEYGHWPEHLIDHRNGIPDDNRIANLRDVTRNVNMQNKRRAHSQNKSGMLGVSAYKYGWRAKIEHQNKTLSLGTFKTAEAARAAYLDAKMQLHEGYHPCQEN